MDKYNLKTYLFPPLVPATPVLHMPLKHQISMAQTGHLFNPTKGTTNVTVNSLAAQLGTETPEIPWLKSHTISVPLATITEVKEWKEWLEDSEMLVLNKI